MRRGPARGRPFRDPQPPCATEPLDRSDEASDPCLGHAPRPVPSLHQGGRVGTGLPLRDLGVSRQDRVLVRDWRADLLFGSADGVLTPAFKLINDRDIRVQSGAADDVEYFHIAFTLHEVIHSEAVETESFRPAADTVSVLSEPQRAELCCVFPELEEGIARIPAARIWLNGRDGRAAWRRGRSSQAARSPRPTGSTGQCANQATFEGGGKVQASVARCLRTPPYAARRKGLSFDTPTAYAASAIRSTVVICNYTICTDNGGNSPRQS